jgi:hypothetical protein
MQTITRTIRTLLIVLTSFLTLTAIGGGIQLLTGFYVPPVEMLAGSPFADYTIPGLALGLVVGGSALIAAVLLIRKNKFASLASASAGVIVMTFEFVEVLVIGFPEGAAGFMQLLYFGLGIIIVAVSFGQWFFELRADAKTASQFSA